MKVNVNGSELLLTIEGTLLDFLPLPVALELVPGVDVSKNRLGSWGHGQVLDWRDAWVVLCYPSARNIWRVVPLQGGRLVLGHASALSDHHLRAADLWQERAAGLLSLLDGLQGNTVYS